ncbi:unnamed protein product, partial [Symbiodinium necroappetens]
SWFKQAIPVDCGKLVVVAVPKYSVSYLADMMWLITAALCFITDLCPVRSKRILVQDHAAERNDWQNDLEDLLEEARAMVQTAARKLERGDEEAFELAKKWFGPEAADDPSVEKELLRVMRSTTNVLSNFKAVK